MVSIIKTNASVDNVKRFIKEIEDTNNSFYTGIGKNDAWSSTLTNLTDDPNFAVNFTPKDDLRNEKDIHENMIAAKRVTSVDIYPAIRKILWQTGTSYIPYDDRDEEIYSKNFYILTSEFKVYKCIVAGTGASSVQPTQTDVLPVLESDGYTWKYMYAISVVNSSRFLTDGFIPCKTILFSEDLDSTDLANYNSQENSKTQINGSIFRYVVTNAGSGYSSNPTVTIEGDGTGATATAIRSPSGQITSVIANVRGSNYNFANVTITGGSGTGATCRAVISPNDGHGSDPQSELGAIYCLLPMKFEENDGEDFFPETSFRQISILKNPLNTTGGAICTATTRNCLNNFTISSHSNLIIGDIITGQTSGTKAFIDRYDAANNKLYFHQNFKTGYKKFTSTGEIVTGSLGGTATLANNGLNLPEMKKFSGRLLAISHRNKITRSTGTGQIGHFILEF